MVGRIRRLLDDCVPSSFAEAASPVVTAVATSAAPNAASVGAGVAEASPMGCTGGGGAGGGGGGGGTAAAGAAASATAAATASASAASPSPATTAAAAVATTPQEQQQQLQRHRKRKERHESCGSAQERKVVRSNSEERPLENGVTRSKETIRRVSSHEDFSSVRTNQKHHHKSKHHHHHHHHHHNHHHSSKIEDNEGVVMSVGDGDSGTTTGGNSGNNSTSTTTTATSTNTSTNNNLNNTSIHSKSFLSEVIDTNMGHGVRMSGHGMPLHERNESKLVSENQSQHSSGERDDDDLVEENEHERRRSSERFSRAAGMSRGRRNMGRRRRPAHAKSSHSSTVTEDADGGSSSKENEEQDCSVTRSHPTPASLSSDEEANSSRSSSSHSFLQLHPQEQERVPSPEPSPSVVGGPPPLDLSTLHQHVGGAEPLTSRATWSREGGEHEEMIANSRVMLSPRNSLILSRRVYLDTNVPPSPPHERDSIAVQVAQARLKQLGKQMSSMKKKLRRLEEEFEKEYGYRPSHAEKATNKEMRKICAELSKIRKETKQLKEDPHNAGIEVQSEENPKTSSKLTALTMEEALQEVEQHLGDKRKHAGRPETLGELTREQLLDEKVAVQKALLHLEDTYGRPVTKGDRDLVRPLYDRYRTLKRMVIRTAPSKMKDSISELATIHEHETMDFTSSPPPLAVADDDSLDENPTTASTASAASAVAAAAAAAAMVASAPPPAMCLSESSEALWKNLHSLPLSELLSQQRSTREEKKRLRRSLREFEEEFQQRTGKKLQREDRVPMEDIYSSYKQAKAKLRLLEALVSKFSS